MAVVRIGMVAGEASGDTLGVHLMAALRKRFPDAEFFGIGGPKMVSRGFDSWFPQEKLAVRGLIEVLRHFRELWGIRGALKRRMIEAQPDLFIGIDSPDFNLGLERRLRGRGITTVHYVSPTVWAWRRGRLRTIRRSVSHMLVLFPFEQPIYEQAGIPVSYVGHPLADEIEGELDQPDMRSQLRLPRVGPVVAMLPGSRQSELAEHAELFVAVARLMLEREPALRFLVPLATRETRVIFEEAIHRAGLIDPPITLLFGHAQDAMAAADVVLVASGTATLEAALLRRPMVVTYRLNPITYAIARCLVRVPYVALPNILAGEQVVPEFLQDEATAENLAQAALNLLGDARVRRAVSQRFASIHAQLRCGTAERAAAALLPYIESGHGVAAG